MARARLGEPIVRMERRIGMRIGAALVVFAMVVAACADPVAVEPAVDTTTTSTTTTTPTTTSTTTGFDRDQVVLRVDASPGLVPAEFILADLPEFVLTGDGRAISLGPGIATVPGSALPPLLVTQLSDDGVARVVAAAEKAGLSDPLDDYGNPGVTDLSSTVFELSTTERSMATWVYALGLDDPVEARPPGSSGFGVTEEQSKARRRITEFNSRLHDLEGWLGNDVIGDPEPYAIDALAVYLAPARDGFFFGEGETEAQIFQWPLAAADGVAALAPYRCVLVEGDDLDALLPLAERADKPTRWLIAGIEHHVVLRPVLPGEVGCESRWVPPTS